MKLELVWMAEHLVIGEAGAVHFQGRKPLPPRAPERDEPAHPLERALLRLLYGELYCRRARRPDEEDSTSAAEWNEFVERLRRANTTRDRWDREWRLEHADPRFVVGRKNSDLRAARMGEFVFDRHSGEPLRPGRSFSLRVHRENIDRSSGFYFAFSSALEPRDAGRGVRFYFHLRREGAAALMESVTARFNRFRIPFQLKCLNHPAHYTRADSGVLYLSTRYAQVGYELLQLIVEPLRPFLRREVPLFTLRLWDGVGFAESPPGGDSFGVSRCRILARALRDSVEAGRPQAAWPEDCIAALRDSGIDLDAPHRNPQSKPRYDFEPHSHG